MRNASRAAGAGVAALAALSCAAPVEALARTAYDAGLAQARHRGASDPACYASVFKTYASLDRFGHWSLRRSRSRNNGFQLELFSRCRISA